MIQSQEPAETIDLDPVFLSRELVFHAKEYILQYQHNLPRFLNYVNYTSWCKKQPLNEDYEIDINPISEMTFRK